MTENTNKVNSPLFSNPMETFPGLTINDLNKYLPAIRTAEDIVMTNENMAEGIFLTKCLDGLKKLPDQSIDLMITNPPENFWDSGNALGEQKTLQEYYKWNNLWMSESFRVLKNTGAIYLFSPWQYSGMYHSLLSNQFKIQSRITWRNRAVALENGKKTWANDTSDIWFATKTEDFLFKQQPVSKNIEESTGNEVAESNLWIDIPNIAEEDALYSQKLYLRILEASSFKLNWVLDPFMFSGDVGVASKQSGRRFVGFETNKDNLLLAMKRIDKS